MDAIRWQGDSLALLDQTRLPTEEVWDDYTDYRKVVDAIRRLVVRGAPAIGIAAAYAVCLAAMEFRDRSPEDFRASMDQAMKDLAASRPTAVNLFWSLDRMKLTLSAAGSGAESIPVLTREADAIHREDIAMNRKIGRYGAELVPAGARILTHCNAGAIATGGYGTALGVVRAAHAKGNVEMVYCDETRPLLQGARLTAWELVKDGIPATLITDNMAASLMAQGKIDMVFLGCDRMPATATLPTRSAPTAWRCWPPTTASPSTPCCPPPPSTCPSPTGSTSSSSSGTPTRSPTSPGCRRRRRALGSTTLPST